MGEVLFDDGAIKLDPPVSIHMIDVPESCTPSKRIVQIIAQWHNKQLEKNRAETAVIAASSSPSQQSSHEGPTPTESQKSQNSQSIQMPIQAGKIWQCQQIGSTINTSAKGISMRLYYLETFSNSGTLQLAVKVQKHVLSSMEASQQSKMSSEDGMEDGEVKLEPVDTVGCHQTLTEKTLHFLIFLFNEKKLFALTTRDAWHVTQPFSSAQFPITIANAWADLDRLLYVESKPLFGDSAIVSDHKKGPKPYRMADLLDQIVTQFKFAVTKDVQKKLLGFESDRKMVTIDVGLRVVRINYSGFTLSRYTEILSEMLEIMEAGPAAAGSANLAFATGLVCVKEADKLAALNNALAQHLFSSLNTPESRHLQIGYKFTKQLHLQASQGFRLRYKLQPRVLKTLKTWDKLPTLDEVIAAIPKGQLARAEDFAKFEISYGRTGTRRQAERSGLLNFIEGEINVGESTYVHVQTKWFHYSHDYIAMVEEEFRSVLRRCYVEPGEVGIVEKWRRLVAGGTNKKLEPEGTYNQRYNDRPNCYLVGDKILTANVELGDIFVLNDGSENASSRLHIVQVKMGFDRSARDACSQIRISANIFKKSPNLVSEFFAKHFKTDAEKIEQWLGRDKTFVFAFVEDSSKGRSIDQEMNTPMVIKRSDDEDGFNSMLEHGYVTERGRLSGKFFVTSLQNLRNDKVEKFGRQFQSSYASTIVKIELIALKRELEALNYSLKIVQIPVEKVDESVVSSSGASNETLSQAQTNSLINDSTQLSTSSTIL